MNRNQQQCAQKYHTIFNLTTTKQDMQKVTNLKYKDNIKTVRCWTYLPTLSAPRSGSDLRMLWKRSARSLGGVFQDRRKSSAYRRRLQTQHVATDRLHLYTWWLCWKHRKTYVNLGFWTCFGGAQWTSKGCDSHYRIHGAFCVSLNKRETFWGLGWPWSTNDGLRGVVGCPQQRDVAAVYEATDILRFRCSTSQHFTKNWLKTS